MNKKKAPYSRCISDRLAFRKGYLLAFFYLFMLFFLASADSWAAEPFQQATGGSGLVSIEAEHYHSHTPQGGHEWLAVSQAGYSGEGALEAYPADRTSVHTGYASTAPRLDYQVEFVTTGTHYIWVRGFGPSTASDSLHVGLNGAEVSSADNIAGFSPTKQWVWSNQRQSTGAVRTLNITSPGVHTINVWMRESGMVFDKLVLTKDASYVPTGVGPAESPRGELSGCGPTFRIMPLGDSITQRRGYRPKLYSDLVNANYNVDFVGSVSDTSGSHDRDHEGHSGWTPAGIAASLYDWLVANPPEVVLLHIGTNELDVFGVEDILNVIDSYSTDITVVLARIINRATYHQPTTEFNAAVAAMAQARIRNGDKILMVDHESALSYPNDMEDELHPNSTGFAKMAVVWFNGLTAFLPACGE